MHERDAECEGVREYTRGRTKGQRETVINYFSSDMAHTFLLYRHRHIHTYTH